MQDTIDQLETAREIDDLHLSIARLRNQVDFANMQLAITLLIGQQRAA